MSSGRNVICCLVCALVGFCSTSTLEAKSVFAITSHQFSTIKAYKIDGSTIEYQADAESDSFGAGAVGICTWPELELMFVTYESSDIIAWASTKILDRDPDDELATGVTNLAGTAAVGSSGRTVTMSRPAVWT